jgi:hypothetical protein
VAPDVIHTEVGKGEGAALLRVAGSVQVVTCEGRCFTRTEQEKALAGGRVHLAAAGHFEPRSDVHGRVCLDGRGRDEIPRPPIRSVDGRENHVNRAAVAGAGITTCGGACLLAITTGHEQGPREPYQRARGRYFSELG